MAKKKTKKKKPDYKTHKIVGRIQVRGKWVNVYRSDRGKLYRIQEPSRNKRYLSKAEEKQVKPHKERPYFLTYDQKTKKYPPKKKSAAGKKKK